MKLKFRPYWIIIFLLLIVKTNTKIGSRKDPMDWEISPFISKNLITSIRSDQNQLPNNILTLKNQPTITVSEITNKTQTPKISKNPKSNEIKNLKRRIYVKTLSEADKTVPAKNLGTQMTQLSLGGESKQMTSTDRHNSTESKDKSPFIKKSSNQHRKLKKKKKMTEFKRHMTSTINLTNHHNRVDISHHHSQFHIGHPVSLARIMGKHAIHNFKPHSHHQRHKNHLKMSHSGPHHSHSNHPKSNFHRVALPSYHDPSSNKRGHLKNKKRNKKRAKKHKKRAKKSKKKHKAVKKRHKKMMVIKNKKKRRLFGMPGGGGGTVCAESTPQIDDSRIIVHSFAAPPTPAPSLVHTALHPYNQVVQANLIMPAKYRGLI